MRQLERPAVFPPTLRSSGKGGQQAASLLRTFAADPSARLEFPDHWNESDVRGALHAMQGFACAYCQGALDERDRGTVDHFRPKRGGPPNGYFWLVYEFSNFLLVCASCNKRKVDQFPLEAGSKHATYETRGAIDAENRLVPDPVRDAMGEWFDLLWKDKNKVGNIDVRPSLASGTLQRKRAEKTLEMFQINIDPALLRARIQAIFAARPSIESKDRAQLRRQACRYLAQGAIVHAFLRECRPELLPSPSEEVLVLLEALFEWFEVADRIREDHPNAKDAAKRRDQILWAFAVIWACPPRQALSSTEIEGWLREHHLMSHVEPLHRRLSEGASPAGSPSTAS